MVPPSLVSRPARSSQPHSVGLHVIASALIERLQRGVESASSPASIFLATPAFTVQSRLASEPTPSPTLSRSLSSPAWLDQGKAALVSPALSIIIPEPSIEVPKEMPLRSTAGRAQDEDLDEWKVRSAGTRRSSASSSVLLSVATLSSLSPPSSPSSHAPMAVSNGAFHRPPTASGAGLVKEAALQHWLREARSSMSMRRSEVLPAIMYGYQVISADEAAELRREQERAARRPPRRHYGHGAAPARLEETQFDVEERSWDEMVEAMDEYYARGGRPYSAAKVERARRRRALLSYTSLSHGLNEATSVHRGRHCHRRRGARATGRPPAVAPFEDWDDLLSESSDDDSDVGDTAASESSSQDSTPELEDRFWPYKDFSVW